MLFTSKKIPVLTLNKSEFSFGWVQLNGKPSWRESLKKSYKKDDLTEQLLQIKTKEKTNNWHVLLGSDCYYLLTTDIPIDKKYSREYIAEIVKSEIPEIYDNSEWDYIEKKSANKKQKTIVIFAPVKSVWDLLKKSCHDAGINILATEATSMAKLRHQNPQIGTAMKQDLMGRDKQTLNLSYNSNPWFSFFKPSPLFLKMIGSSIIAGFVCTLIILKIYSQMNLAVSTQDLSVELATPAEATPTQEVPSPSTISIQILNGSSSADLSEKIVTQLLTAGFTNLSKGTTLIASNSSEIKNKATTSKELVDQISKILENEQIKVTQNDILSESADFDTIIIVR